MTIKTLEEAKNIAYKATKIDLNHEYRPLIIDELTLDFEWGYVFYYNGKKCIEEKDASFSYLPSGTMLVDKIDGTTHYVGGVFKVLDSELEKYRASKGYPPVIKFPIKDNLDNKTLIEKIQCYFKTGEISQIKIGLEMAKKNRAFNLKAFKEVMYKEPDMFGWTFEENIARAFGKECCPIDLGEKKKMPKNLNLELFNSFPEISLSSHSLLTIDETLLQLPNLEGITINADIEYITPRIVELEKLSSIKVCSQIRRLTLSEQVVDLLVFLRDEKGVFIDCDDHPRLIRS
jgi:hypothetical protein